MYMDKDKDEAKRQKTMTKPLIRALKRESVDTGSRPFWFMRQAGRYMADYRKVRADAGTFLDLVYDSEKAAEVTLQPVRAFQPSAAILFADILIVPHALGQDVSFVKGEGPKLAPVRDRKALAALAMDGFDRIAGPVCETVRKVAARLPEDTALIGFAGAPWTVASYMIEGGGSKTFAQAKTAVFADSEFYGALEEMLVEATVHYLSAQVEAGAGAVQLFDTWASMLDEKSFHTHVIEPARAITEKLKDRHPDIPVIGFPKGAGPLYEDYARETGVDCVGLDSLVPLDWAVEKLSPHAVLQGNLDPVRLLGPEEDMLNVADMILRKTAGIPHIFNLGHGILPETDLGRVRVLADHIRGWRP